MKAKLFTLMFFFCLFSKAQENHLDYEEVVNRLTDLKSLAELPKKGEGSAMWSSYDRQSRLDPETGEYLNWAANNDGLTPQFIRKEGEQEILAEIEGPGALVRIWSASPGEGKVKIYVDGKEEPVIALPFIDFFRPSIPAFEFSELVYETNAQGFNNYVPITFQKSCKIVAEKGWGQYYHFNYISFPEGTQVEDFDPQMQGKNLEALEKVNSFFKDKLGDNPGSEVGKKETVIFSVAPGEKRIFFNKNHSGAVSSIRVRMPHLKKEELDEILRKVVLTMKWDGEKEPSVWSPLGDFFGTSPGWNEYRTLPMGMTEDWMYSYWYMPFATGAEIAVVNEFEEVVQIEMELQHETLEDVEGLGRFHAKWHRDLQPLEESRWPDWTLLETSGMGRFVGTHLLVWNPKGGSCSAAEPGQHWWGEGDEKFFVDGEEFPSTFGTGTEDYFGYAWCNPARFEHAFHSQTLDNDNMGYQPMNRWHIIDNIPFQSSFNGYLEKYFPNHWPTQYSVVVYWYLDAKGKDPLGATPVEERFGYEIPYNVYRKEGVVEGEQMEIGKSSGGWVSPDVWAHESLYDEVSGHKVMIWHAPKEKGAYLVLDFAWPEAGTYKVTVNKVLSRDGGNFRVYFNDGLVKDISFESGEEEHASTIEELGTIEIKPGVQQLKLEWMGQEETGSALRIDYLKLEKIER